MNHVVLTDFFINFCILCTGLFLIHILFKRIRRNIEPSSAPFKLTTGIAQGLFGVLLMHFGIPISKTVLIDLRTIPIMVAAQIGGPFSSVLAAIIITLFRFALYPYSNSSLLNAGILLVTGVSFGLISITRMRKDYQWWVMAAGFAVLLGSTIWLVIPERNTALVIYFQYVFSILVATYFTQELLAYLWRSHDTFNRLREASRKDFLTGLQNTRSFDTEMNQAYAQAREKHEALSLLMIDIDYFKRINDTYGHPVGDEILKQVAHVFLQASRSIDIVCRNGGEEFSVILPACDSGDARRVAERIRSSIETNVFLINDAIEIRLTVSIGVSTVTDFTTTSVERLIQLADDGLYIAKRTGRNCVYFQQAG